MIPAVMNQDPDESLMVLSNSDFTFYNLCFTFQKTFPIPPSPHCLPADTQEGIALQPHVGLALCSQRPIRCAAPSLLKHRSSTQTVNHLPSVPVIHSCCNTPQLSRIEFLQMSVHGDIHSPAQQKGLCSLGQGEWEMSLQMWGRTCVAGFFFFFGLKELRLLCDGWRLGQPAFFKMHIRMTVCCLTTTGWLEPVNELWESVCDGERIYLQWWTYWQFYTRNHYHAYSSLCLHFSPSGGTEWVKSQMVVN